MNAIVRILLAVLLLSGCASSHIVSQTKGEVNHGWKPILAARVSPVEKLCLYERSDGGQARALLVASSGRVEERKVTFQDAERMPGGAQTWLIEELGEVLYRPATGPWLDGRSLEFLQRKECPSVLPSRR